MNIHSLDTEHDHLSEDPTNNEYPSIENMEVQKHPHHVTHTKKWTEYLLEFFMLFLAVFLGFVAENIREDKVEKSRAVKFAKNLLSDLKKDTAEFTVAIAKQQINSKGIDTLIQILRRPDYQSHLKDFLNKFPYIYNNYIITRYDATSQQLTYSGNLRLFENIDLYNNLTSYYSQIRKYNETMNSLSAFRQPIIDNMAGILDYRNNIDSTIHMHSIKDASGWLAGNEQALNKFILNISVLQTIFSGQVIQINILKQKATLLVDQISQEYK